MALLSNQIFPGAVIPDAQVQAINLTMQTPADLARHSIAKEYVMRRITPSDFLLERGGAQFDINELQMRFRTICGDYGDELGWNTPSLALDFCSKMIFEVAPESRSVKKASGDKTWKFIFPNTANGVYAVSVLFVCTYKADDAKYVEYSDAGKMTLPVKQASILAMSTLQQAVALGAIQNPPQLVLTPLAGSVFSRQDIGHITTIFRTPNDGATVTILNESCQSGGHHLPHSVGSVAVLATIINTRKLAESGKVSEANSIIGKITKQYITAKGEETINKELMSHLALYAHGGVPAGLDPKSLIKAVTSENAIQARNISNAAGTVTVPPGGISASVLNDMVNRRVHDLINQGVIAVEPRSDRPADDEMASPDLSEPQPPGNIDFPASNNNDGRQ